MIAHRQIDRIIAALVAIAVLLCFGAIWFAGPLAEAVGGLGVKMEYETELFDTSQPITVNILMDEGQWEQMLAEATAEEYWQCDVEINGVTFYQVGIRPKGNNSLTSIASDPTTDRYSFKLEFDQYVEGQTCYGLDKLVLNDNYADATNMKEALVYDMYQYLGADASLYNYARISVNGEYWGVYLALEAVEDSFLLRNYGVNGGELYKPENSGGGMAAGAAGRSGSASAGADLNYIDDELDSYSAIWDGEVTDSSRQDHQRVVSALSSIASGSDPQSCMDVDNLLKYMAVHTFSVNGDSLSGSMAHNYYLHEKNGRLNLIPWDYNLAFGAFGTGTNGASAVINDAIDTPFPMTQFFDVLLENPDCLAQYHEYLRLLAEEYVAGGEWDAFCQHTRSQIDTLVETDPTAFYTYEQYDAAVQMLDQTVQLRAQSILGQLEGTIPSTDAEQQANPSALLNAANIDLNVMSNTGGSRGMEGGGQEREEKEAGFRQNGGAEAAVPAEGAPFEGRGGNFPQDGEFPANVPVQGKAFTENGEEATQQFTEKMNGRDTARQPGTEMGAAPSNAASSSGTASPVLVLYAVSFAAAVAALAFAACYRQRSRRL